MQGGGPAFTGPGPGQQQTQQQSSKQYGTSTQNQTMQISTNKSGTSASSTTTAQAQNGGTNGNGMPQPPSGGTMQPPGQQNGTGGPPGAQGMNGGGPGGSSSGLSRADTTLLSLLKGSGARGSQSLSGESVISSDLVKLAKIVKANTTKDQVGRVERQLRKQRHAGHSVDRAGRRRHVDGRIGDAEPEHRYFQL